MELELRRKLLKLYFGANCGHIACSLSCLDLLIALFNQKQTHERIILSKGHAAGALYVMLNHTGEISDEELETFYQNGTKLSAHPSANSFINIPFALGSLGHGFPIASGMAQSKKIKGDSDFVYVLMSDGETNEGTTWEAAHFAVANRLDNLIVVIDRNRLQGFGGTADVLGDTADVTKWQTMGFHVLEVDGHDLDALESSIQECKLIGNGKPHVIIANTVKGKGVDYMENKMEWHYLPMNEEKYQEALESLEKVYHA
jgi:transketolase